MARYIALELYVKMYWFNCAEKFGADKGKRGLMWAPFSYPWVQCLMEALVLTEFWASPLQDTLQTAHPSARKGGSFCHEATFIWYKLFKNKKKRCAHLLCWIWRPQFSSGSLLGIVKTFPSWLYGGEGTVKEIKALIWMCLFGHFIIDIKILKTAASEMLIKCPR